MLGFYVSMAESAFFDDPETQISQDCPSVHTMGAPRESLN